MQTASAAQNDGNRSGNWGRRLAAVLCAAALAGSAGGCIVVSGWGENDGGWSSWSFDDRVEGELTLQTEAVMDRPLEVRTRNGAISVIQDDGKDVRVKAHIRARTDERLKATQVRATRGDDGKLSIEVLWPGGRAQNNEGASLEVRLPSAQNLTLDTSNGPITVRGFGGTARLDTSNGPVTIEGFSGTIDAETSNGPVEVRDAKGPVTVDTSNGPVRVELNAANPGPVKVDTSNGGITLIVGTGFVGTLSADTSNGGVEIPDGVKVISKSKSAARIQFGSGGSESILDASNGGISIRRRD